MNYENPSKEEQKIKIIEVKEPEIEFSPPPPLRKPEWYKQRGRIEVVKEEPEIEVVKDFTLQKVIKKITGLFKI